MRKSALDRVREEREHAAEGEILREAIVQAAVVWRNSILMDPDVESVLNAASDLANIVDDYERWQNQEAKP